MTHAKLSQSPYFNVAATIFALLFLGFGINAMLWPRNALNIFGFEPPASASDQKLVDGLIIIYGVRDIFMGLAMCSATYFGNSKTLGWILVAGSGVAYVDGAVCWSQIGRGEWNHWGYAPALTIVGSVLVGILDRP